MRRQVRSVSKNPTTGQEVETFADGSLYWCRIEVESGRRQQDYGAQQTGTDATIYVRNMPELSALDRLYAVEWAETWIIDSIMRGDNEMICDCYRYDELAV
jgi:head-tail adaptor